MARKTRKRTSTKGVSTIPELRRSFEYVENTVDEMIHSHATRAEMVSCLRKEWRKVFDRDLSKSMAESFIDHRLEEKKVTPSSGRRRKTRRHAGGMAPIEAVTRAGHYLAPGQIPTAQGTLPLSSGAASAYGSFTDYVSKGFTNPEIAQQYDPVKGQAQWPVPMRGGSLVGSAISQAFMRPIGSSEGPPSVLSDMQRMYNGSSVSCRGL